MKFNWLPDPARNELDTWCLIEEIWDYNIVGADVIRDIIRVIIVSRETIQNWLLTSQRSQLTFPGCFLEVIEFSTTRFPSPEVTKCLRASLRWFVESRSSNNKTFSSFSFIPTTYTATTAVPTATVSCWCRFWRHIKEVFINKRSNKHRRKR